MMNAKIALGFGRTKYRRPEYLKETGWLEKNLSSKKLRIFDCAAIPAPNTDEARRGKFPVSPQAARALYEEKHIPGAGFIDAPKDLTDQSSEIPMMAAPVDQLIQSFTQAGIRDDSNVVLYSSTTAIWSARVWWVLRSIGFDRAAILNGGFKKWAAEARPISSGSSIYPKGKLTPATREDVFVDKERVLAALDEKDTLLIHGLAPSAYKGSDDSRVFGRRGHIPGSINIPSGALLDPQSGAYRSARELHDIFEKAGCKKAKRIITYCGGGINASAIAFALVLVGYENISVYDGSMNEWGNDETLPIEVGQGSPYDG